MNAGKITLLVLGSVGALIAAALLAGGGISLWVDTAKTDDDGYITSGAHEIRTTAHALVSDDIEIDTDAGWLFDDGDFVKVRLTGTAAESGAPVFMGVAPRAQVRAYLDSVA
jgi:hypothetical protein